MNVGAALVAFFLNGVCHFSLNLEAARIPINSLSSVDLIRDSKHQHAAKLIDQQEPGNQTTGNQEQFFDLVVKILSANNQQLFKRDDDIVSTTIQPATVDIKTLPGYWLKDPSVLEPATSHEVDYRTERYRLDDLLKASDTPAAE